MAVLHDGAETLTQSLAIIEYLDELRPAPPLLGRRPSLYQLTERMAAINVPTLVAFGDEDELCLEPSLLIKRVVPKAGLAVFPKTGHAVNLEEPDALIRVLCDFLHQVSQQKWGERAPRCRARFDMGARREVRRLASPTSRPSVQSLLPVQVDKASCCATQLA